MAGTSAPKAAGINGEVASYAISGAVPGGDAVAAHHRDGVVCLRNACSSDWLAVIEEGIEAALSGASADLDVVKIEGDRGRFGNGSA